MARINKQRRMRAGGYQSISFNSTIDLQRPVIITPGKKLCSYGGGYPQYVAVVAEDGKLHRHSSPKFAYIAVNASDLDGKYDYCYY